MKYSSRQRTLLAATTAILWWLSLQKIGLFAFGWIALTPLLYAASTLPAAHERFWFGWRSGFLCFALINWWLWPTITKASPLIGIPSAGGFFLGVLAVAIIATGHGLGVALLTVLWNPRHKLFDRASLFLPIVAALYWYAFEAVRGYGTLANTWGSLAFSQWSDPALLQSARFIGQYGLSALCVWLAASFALWLVPEYSARRPVLWSLPVIALIALHGFGAWRIVDYDMGQESSQSDALLLGIAVVQTNVSSLDKNRGNSESQFDQAERLTREYFSRSREVGIVVWPETTATFAMPMHGGSKEYDIAMQDAPNMHVARSKSIAGLHATPLLTGAQVTKLRSQSDFELSNRAVLFSGQKSGAVTSINQGKTHVVPFGESAPFGDYFPVLRQLAPEPPVTPAKKIRTLAIETFDGKVPIGTLICFESAFSDPAKSLVAQGAKVLFVLASDDWFSGTTGPWEHAAMSALRAVENDVPVLQSANGGYSFHIDSRGRFVKLLDYGQAGILQADVPLNYTNN